MLHEVDEAGKVKGDCGSDLPIIDGSIVSDGKKAQEKGVRFLRFDEVLLRLELLIESYGSARAFAKAHGISENHICKFRTGRSNPNPKLLKALGLKQNRVYEVDPSYDPSML